MTTMPSGFSITLDFCESIIKFVSVQWQHQCSPAISVMIESTCMDQWLFILVLFVSIFFFHTSVYK